MSNPPSLPHRKPATLHIECDPAEKSAWVKAAGGGKLDQWVRDQLNAAAVTGESVAAWRVRESLSQRAAADLLGVSHGQLARIETGMRAVSADFAKAYLAAVARSGRPD